jgi:hypothetical protein
VIYPAPAETTDWAQRGSQSRAYPDPECASELSFLDGMSQSEAIVTLGFLWASVQYPDVIADLLGCPGGPFADDSPTEDQPSAPTEIEGGSAPEDGPAQTGLERALRFFRQLPGPWREELLQVLRNRKAALKTALRMLRNLRAHRGTPARRPAPIPAVLASQRIRMLLSAQPTHAP